MARQRTFGVTVLGDFIVSEGIEPILDRLQEAGVTAVACNPTVTTEAPENQGTFQPPADAGTSPRRFDRPLFGKPALWVRGGPSYHPRADYYKDIKYGPRRVNDLTDSHGHLIGDFIKSAISRGLKVYLQVGAAQPTGLKDEDRPRLPDGTLPPGRMADTASLASEAVVDYNRAYFRDLLEEYPGVCGVRPDWPEYPCYTLGEVFQDFSPHVERWAKTAGFDFAAILDEVQSFYQLLHGGLNNDMLAACQSAGDLRFALMSLLARRPGLFEWFRMKSALSLKCLRDWRSVLDDAGGQELELSAHAFMPAYSLVTGFDFARAAEICHSISPKFYTMHWSLMVDFWGRPILENNPGLNESLLVSLLLQLMDIVEEPAPGVTLADYGYPGPDDPHQIANRPQERKIAEVLAAVGGACEVFPLMHGYGPLDDFSRRFEIVAKSPADGVWVNRYGYLSDEKLQAMGGIWSASVS